MLKKLRSYENRLLLILALSFGFAFYDRNAVGFLAQYIVRDLQLSNTQLGMLGSILSLSWAVSAFVVGRWSDVAGVRKPFLIASLIVFSICSFLSGMSTSFYTLLASRLIMGIAEGPLMPICQAIIIAESTSGRRGLNVGIVQIGPPLLGAAIAPIVLVPLAEWFDWRVAFFVAGIPGILCALAVGRWVREPLAAPALERRAVSRAIKGWASVLFRERNVWLCTGIACLMISWLMLQQSFLPIFLTTIRNLTGQQMSQVMSVTGICAMISGFLGATISDRIGRKPVTAGACLISVLAPLSGLYFYGPVAALAALMFIGWLGTAAVAQFLAIIPGETLPGRYVATAIGMIVAISEVVGGFGAPLVGGWAADQTTLAAPLKLAAASALGATILAFFLKETAPVKVGVASINVVEQD